MVIRPDRDPAWVAVAVVLMMLAVIVVAWLFIGEGGLRRQG